MRTPCARSQPNSLPGGKGALEYLVELSVQPADAHLSKVKRLVEDVARLAAPSARPAHQLDSSAAPAFNFNGGGPRVELPPGPVHILRSPAGGTAYKGKVRELNVRNLDHQGLFLLHQQLLPDAQDLAPERLGNELLKLFAVELVTFGGKAKVEQVSTEAAGSSCALRVVETSHYRRFKKPCTRTSRKGASEAGVCFRSTVRFIV